MTFGAEIIAHVLVCGFRQVRILLAIFHLAQQLADQLHVVVVQVCFSDFCGVVSGKDLNLDDIALVLPRAQLLTAKITGNV